MSSVKEKIAYLRGMIDATETVKDESVRGIFHRIIEVLDEMADDVDDLMLEQEEIEDYIEAIDSDLNFLEDELYEDDDGLVEMECPNCRERVMFEEDFLYDDDVEVSCPECSAVVFSGESLDEDDDENENEHQ